MKKNVPKDNTVAKQKWEQKKAELISEVEEKFKDLMRKEETQKLQDDLAELDSPGASKTKKK